MKTSSEEMNNIPILEKQSPVKVDAKHIDTRESAILALKLYFDKVDVAFELVRTGRFCFCFCFCNAIHLEEQVFHMNFEAKRKDDPQARVQTFFAEFTATPSGFVPRVCYRFGPTDSPIDKGCTDTCMFCRGELVCHPSRGGYRNGFTPLENITMAREKAFHYKTVAENFQSQFSDSIKSEAYKLVTIALNFYHQELDQDIELVKVGCLKEAVTSNGSGKIWHMNFDAIEEDDENRTVKTFFAELTKTNTNDSIKVDLCYVIGSIDTLLEDSRIGWCLYCGDDPIFHPRFDCYHCGREDQPMSEILKNQKLFKLKDAAVYVDVDGGTEIERSLPMRDRNAIAALKVYNEKNGTNFELVRLRSNSAVALQLGIVMHQNFEARNKNEDRSQIKMFFTEVISNYSRIGVDCCHCLGDTDSLPDIPDEFSDGCSYCHGVIHHPPGLGYLTGWEDLFAGLTESDND